MTIESASRQRSSLPPNSERSSEFPTINKDRISTKTVYRDDIPALERIIWKARNQEREVSIIGYRGFAGQWISAPDRKGNISSDLKQHRSLESRNRNTRPNTWSSHRDSLDRIYLLVPANGGHVPVRHGTDPSLGNWLLRTIPIRIVYDSHGCRHPECDQIDYEAHGFRLHGKAWWPIQSGNFQPTLQRMTAPYYPNWKRLKMESPSTYDTASIGAPLALSAIALLVPSGGFISAVNVCAASIGGVRALAEQENRKMLTAQAKRTAENSAQGPILEQLKRQDSVDLCEQILVLLQTDFTLANIEELLHRNSPIRLHPEDRGNLAIHAVHLRNHEALVCLLKNGDIPPTQAGQALFLSTRQEYLPAIETLLSPSFCIPSELFGKAVIQAATNENPIIMEALLKYGTPNPDDRGVALVETVQRGNQRNIDLLLKNNAYIPMEYRGQAAIQAALCGQIPLLNRILEIGPISFEHRVKMQTILAGPIPIRENSRAINYNESIANTETHRTSLTVEDRIRILNMIQPQQRPFSYHSTLQSVVFAACGVILALASVWGYLQFEEK